MSFRKEMEKAIEKELDNSRYLRDLSVTISDRFKDKSEDEDVRSLLENLNLAEEMTKSLTDSLISFSDNYFKEADIRKEVRIGRKNGLSEKQVAIYADRKFNRGQMYWIRTGLERGLSEEQVGLYAKPEFTSYQMSVLQAELEFNKNMEQIKLLADPRLSWKQMRDVSDLFGRCNHLEEDLGKLSPPEQEGERGKEMREELNKKKEELKNLLQQAGSEGLEKSTTYQR